MTTVNITVVMGNIARQTDCDDVANSANPKLRSGSGVCGAIYAEARPRLEPYSSQFAPLQIGEALVTPAFNMGYRYIIHTRADQGRRPDRALRTAIEYWDWLGHSWYQGCSPGRKRYRLSYIYPVKG